VEGPVGSYNIIKTAVDLGVCEFPSLSVVADGKALSGSFDSSQPLLINTGELLNDESSIMKGAKAFLTKFDTAPQKIDPGDDSLD